MATTAYEDLLSYIDTLEIIDTHEHLPNEADWAALDQDVLTEWLSHYFPCDLISAGLPPEVMENEIKNSALPLADRWRTLEPFWLAAANTGYARALEIAARDLYGIDSINAETIEELNRLFLDRRSKTAEGKSHYHYVLKEKSRIAVSLNDNFSDPAHAQDEAFFKPVYRLEGVIDLNTAEALEVFGATHGIRIHTLEDYVAAVEVAIGKAYGGGAVALKVPFAYSRPIHFKKVTRAEAEGVFNGIFGLPGGEDAGALPAPAMATVVDYMMHQALRLADNRGLVVQVHTGLQEGNGNVISNSNPELLINLFMEYRNVTFDIFHISYPYQNVLAAIAKNFANVVIDMCWAHIISPEASVRALVEFLDSVPANKISAFGGDYLFPDGVYGHQRMARQNVARALAQRVESGFVDVDGAKEIATWLFVDNPRRIFGLDF